MYTRDMERTCNYKTCRARRKFVRCPNCQGKGPGKFTTCKNKCDSGYKCERGINDPYHVN